MKTREQILKRIEEIKKDVRYSYKPALVEINAPLALVQTAMEAEIRSLLWVLKREEEPTYKNKEST